MTTPLEPHPGQWLVGSNVRVQHLVAFRWSATLEQWVAKHRDSGDPANRWVALCGATTQDIVRSDALLHTGGLRVPLCIKCTTRAWQQPHNVTDPWSTGAPNFTPTSVWLPAVSHAAGHYGPWPRLHHVSTTKSSGGDIYALCSAQLMTPLQARLKYARRQGTKWPYCTRCEQLLTEMKHPR